MSVYCSVAILIYLQKLTDTRSAAQFYLMSFLWLLKSYLLKLGASMNRVALPDKSGLESLALHVPNTQPTLSDQLRLNGLDTSSWGWSNQTGDERTILLYHQTDLVPLALTSGWAGISAQTGSLSTHLQYGVKKESPTFTLFPPFITARVWRQERHLRESRTPGSSVHANGLVRLEGITQRRTPDGTLEVQFRTLFYIMSVMPLWNFNSLWICINP